MSANVQYEDNRGRSRSRSRDRDDFQQNQQQQQEGQNIEENFNIYVTNLAFETNDDSLRAAFETIGPVKDVQVIVEPINRISRGFAFVQMEKVEDSLKVLQSLDGYSLDGRQIRVEKARRKGGYEKTPGTYMGPPGLSTKYGRRRGDDDRRRDRSRDRGDRFRPTEREFRDTYRERDRLAAPPIYRDDRFRDDRFRDDRFVREDFRAPPRFDPRFDPRDVRSSPPPFHGGYDRRSPPREREFRGGMPMHDRHIPSDYERPFPRGAPRY